MVKYRIIAGVLLIIMVLPLLLAGCGPAPKYSGGKDTVDLYGDGTFQICRGSDHWSLIYSPTGSGIIDDITAHWHMGNYVYVIGHNYYNYKAYGVINESENTLRLCWVDTYREYVPDQAIESGDIVLVPDFMSFTEKEQEQFMKQEGKQLWEYQGYIPLIDSFSSTSFDQMGYGFPPIESAALLHDGISEPLDPNDPRLFRLLNALSFSAQRDYTQVRQEPVEEAEFQTYLNHDCVMLDITFQSYNIPDALKSSRTLCRMVVSANRILLVNDGYEIFLHSPFQSVLKDHKGVYTNKVWQEMASAALWGDPDWLNLLTYARFTDWDGKPVV